MKLISEERYDRLEVRETDKILDVLHRLDLEIYSAEFFVSETFLVIKIYKKEIRK